jgi:hypothetical protein
LWPLIAELLRHGNLVEDAVRRDNPGSTVGRIGGSGIAGLEQDSVGKRIRLTVLDAHRAQGVVHVVAG